MAQLTAQMASRDPNLANQCQWIRSEVIVLYYNSVYVHLSLPDLVQCPCPTQLTSY